MPPPPEVTAVVSPEQILKDLRELWAGMAQDQADSGGVLRACSMTFVVTARDASDADLIRQTLGVLMHNHPSRAIIVHDAGSAAPAQEAGAQEPVAQELEAHIFSECWKPFGSTQQICSEGIEIAPGAGEGDGMAEVARFIVPLRAPDLPLVLWRRGALGSGNRRGVNPPAHQGYDALLALADKLIFDTADAPDSAGALAYLRSLQTAGRRVADLNWTRLSGWREVIAHLFDDATVQADAVESVNISYGGGRLTTSALYMASLIRSAIPGAPVIVDAVNSPAREPGGLVSIEFSSASDHLTLCRAEGDCVHVTGTGRDYYSTLPPARVEDLMREELGILGRDPVYERVLAS
jgi:glucose-6-phosphate dehydrogenase assembly protein OpcA